MSNVPAAKIQEYLDLFDGDVVRAVRALQRQGERQPRKQLNRQPKRPLSDEVGISVSYKRILGLRQESFVR